MVTKKTTVISHSACQHGTQWINASNWSCWPQQIQKREHLYKIFQEISTALGNLRDTSELLQKNHQKHKGVWQTQAEHGLSFSWSTDRIPFYRRLFPLFIWATAADVKCAQLTIKVEEVIVLVQAWSAFCCCHRNQVLIQILPLVILPHMMTVSDIKRHSAGGARCVLFQPGPQAWADRKTVILWLACSVFPRHHYHKYIKQL